jgi:hypothetical protein
VPPCSLPIGLFFLSPNDHDMTLSLDAALARFSDGSPFRAVFPALTSTDPAERGKVAAALKPLLRPYWEPPRALPETEALAALDAVFGLDFPPPASRFDRGPGQVLVVLFGSATPALLARVEAHYGAAPASLRLDLLTLVASAGTRPGAELLRALLERYGWPDSFHARFFTELGRNLPHADVLVPALIDLPGGPLVDLGDFALRAARGGTLSAAQLGSASYCQDLAGRLRGLISERSKVPTEDPEALQDLDAQLGLVLDLAGFVGGPDQIPELEAALALPAPRLVTFAVGSLFRRGAAVPDEVIARLAAEPSTLELLYGVLKGFGATERIPPALRTRDAFAAAEMVGWLSHPNELGQAPAALERMAVFEHGQGDDAKLLYVWRFQPNAGDAWMAGVSGPYPAQAPEGPLSGESTFSRFEPWDQHDAQGHAAAIMETLDGWAKAQS